MLRIVCASRRDRCGCRVRFLHVDPCPCLRICAFANDHCTACRLRVHHPAEKNLCSLSFSRRGLVLCVPAEHCRKSGAPLSAAFYCQAMSSTLCDALGFPQQASAAPSVSRLVCVFAGGLIRFVAVFADRCSAPCAFAFSVPSIAFRVALVLALSTEASV
jgi:hypothetical protein